MVIIVTGTIGVGKTTVCRKLIQAARSRGYTCGGILTCKAADKSIIVEDIHSGEKETLASISNVYDGPHTARYFFDPKGICFGIQAIDKGISAEILLVDEIGPLELRGEAFVRVIELIRTGKVRNCILVIRKNLLSAFLPRLNTEPVIFETTLDNRNQLPGEIEALLTQKMVKSEEP
ncbi:nucleoside-triphosphatase [Chloroflexota bacterium]